MFVNFSSTLSLKTLIYQEVSNVYLLKMVVNFIYCLLNLDIAMLTF